MNLHNFKSGIIRLLALTSAVCVISSSAALADEQILFYDGASHVYDSAPIQLQIDGEIITDLPMPPIIMNDRTLVPARETFEALGAVVSWNDSTREVYIGYNNKLIILQIDSQIANSDGSLEVMDVAPKIINNKTMIPLRFVSEGFGLDVQWNPERRIASIASKAPQVSEAPPPLTPEQTDMPRDASQSKMTVQQHPQTWITDVRIPTGGASVFAVTASSPITKVESFSLADRIVLDIYNAEMFSPQTTWMVDSATVTQVRMAQNQTVPEMITRVVFDLKLAATYRVSMSSDRTEVYVVFENNHVSDVRFRSDGMADYVDISLNGVSPVNVFHLTKPDRVVIDVPYSTISNIFEQPVSGRFARALRANQFEAYTARIVLELNGRVQHIVSVDETTVTIMVTEPTFRNIEYDELNRTIVFGKGGTNLSAAGITHYDAYTANKYILTLPVDLSGVIGYGEYMVTDDYLRSISIRNNSAGLTELTLNERQVLAASVTEDSASVYVKLLNPREVYPRVVVIDPGHGGSDPGAMANGLQEKDVNLSIANMVMALLEQDGSIKAYTTRQTDISVDLSDRPVFGNSVGDLFISIHNNAADKNPNANGTETYYYDHEFEHLLGISGKRVAEILYGRLISYLSSNERKVHYKDLLVTRESVIPAALVEIGFITNAEEAAKLAGNEYRQLAAQAIFDGIIEIFGQYTPRR